MQRAVHELFDSRPATPPPCMMSETHPPRPRFRRTRSKTVCRGAFGFVQDAQGGASRSRKPQLAFRAADQPHKIPVGPRPHTRRPTSITLRPSINTMVTPIKVLSSRVFQTMARPPEFIRDLPAMGTAAGWTVRRVKERHPSSDLRRSTLRYLVPSRFAHLDDRFWRNRFRSRHSCGPTPRISRPWAAPHPPADECQRPARTTGTHFS